MKGFLYAVLAVSLGLCLSSPAWAEVKVRAVVDKSEQHVYVYDGKGHLLYSWCASTGKVSSYSRTGTFRPTKYYPGKRFSGSYGGSMIDSVYYDGKRAIHGVDEPANLAALCKYGTSYGCVHVSPENAHTFNQLTKPLKPREVEIVIRQ